MDWSNKKIFICVSVSITTWLPAKTDLALQAEFVGQESKAIYAS